MNAVRVFADQKNVLFNLLFKVMNTKQISSDKFHVFALTLSVVVFVILSLLEVDNSALKAVSLLFVLELIFIIISKSKNNK
jgi:hypothetical protein